MKKLWTILILCLVCVFCAVGFAACGDDKTEPEPEPAAPTSVAMTKDEFLTELGKREAATFADTSLHYATVDCKLVFSEGDADFDGTYEQTCDVTYGTNQYEENFVYTSVKTGKGNNTRWQQQRLFCSDYFNDIFASISARMPDLLAAFKFEKDGDNLKLLCDTEYTVEETTIKMYMEYEFDVNGYLKYRKESTGDGTTGESIEFTAKVYNKEKVLTVDAFLNTLRELEHLSYEDVRYASVSATNIEQEGTNPQTTKTGDFNLVYYIDSQGNQLAVAQITDEQGHLTTSVTVLGLYNMMAATVENAENGEYAVKRVGSNYDVTAEFDDAESHIHIIAHYVFDMNGYAVYMSYQGEGYATEFTATAYNKEEEGDETIEYTVNSEQWDKGVTLYWTNVTYEFTDGTRGNKVELLEDGGLHQYAGVGGGWGEFYVIYKNSKWQVYQGDNTTLSFEYDTETAYKAGSYGDDFGFMGHMLPTIRGRMDEFTFDEANHQYIAENIGISMGPDDVYPMNVTAKFENQKLVYVKFAAVGGDEYMEATFTDYGTTVIEYPDYILNGSSEESGDETISRFEFVSVEPESYASYLDDSYVELSGENSITIRWVHTNYSGTYELDGDNIHIDAYSGSSSRVILDGVIDGNVLTITASDGTVVIYNKSVN